jgi:crotonobetaine/carnitine-CoA ligase
VEVVESLPKNALARVMKHHLREHPLTASTWDFEAMGLVVSREERRP